MFKKILQRLRKQTDSCVITDKDTESFFGHCMAAYAVYINLNEMDTYQDVLKKTAPTFFGDVHSFFKEHLILQVCKMDDPYMDNRGNKNLTLEFFIKGSTGKKKKKLNRLKSEMNNLLKKLRPARNKIIAHIDHETLLSENSLGAAEEVIWEHFWKNLEEFLRELKSDFVLRDVGQLTDVACLIRDLQAAHTHFDICPPA